MSDLTSLSANTPSEPLTRREREVLGLLAEGLTGPEIAEHLTLGLSTVKWHIDHVYSKLGVGSKRQAIKRGHALGLLAGEGSRPRPAPVPEVPAPPEQPHNLPAMVTRFFGREAELVNIRSRLAEDRLVTLTGLGGVGKSRLALQAAEALIGDFPDGVWFVDLASLFDSALVAQQVATTLGLRDVPGRPALESLTSSLRQRHMLILLDNCEHLLDGCAQLCDTLLRACPRLRLLACSREPLGIAGEVILLVPSLPCPEAGQALSPQLIEDYPSVRLFTDRARFVRPNYQVAHHNAAAVADICRRVDGIPLAIEMAAARINTLSAEQLAARLGDAFRLLTSGSRTAQPRQQTLRATIDWSYELLSLEERVLLQRLSIFAGGWTLEAAEAICSGDGLPSHQVLDYLAALVAKSLIVAERQPGGETRYRLLEMVRQYAGEKLKAAGEAKHLGRRHRDYFLTFAEQTNARLATDEQGRWQKLREAERANLRQALEWSFSDEDEPEAALQLLFAMATGLPTWQEGFDWFTKAVAWCESAAGVSKPMYARVLCCASVMASLNNLQTGLAWAERAVEISRGLGVEGRDSLAESLGQLSGRYLDLGEAASAAVAFAEMETLLLERGPDALDVQVKVCLACSRALLALALGQPQAARACIDEAMQLSPPTADRVGRRGLIKLLGDISSDLGDFEQARGHFLEVLSLSAALPGDDGHNAHADALRCLADVAIRQGNLSDGLEACQASIRRANEIPDYNLIASGLGLIAIICARQDDRLRTAILSGASQAMYARQQRTPWEDASLDTLLPGWREQPDQVDIHHAFKEGTLMSSERAIAYALGDEHS
jgi:predicted ATPase/DNA-binding CsgD family transcriptional regulator